jgi:catechol 2,3-dioxygenase-like lactoylglutathione lyase family enzyme
VKIPGIHHITAIASDPQRNLDFYTAVLGLRLVKLTVNFDDPGTYHFYFADEAGRPGSILTFFPWPGAMAGRHGSGQAAAISFSVPTLDGWAARLPGAKAEQRFGQDLLSFADPDGLPLELIAAGGAGSGIRGFHGVTLSEAGYESTAKLLTETFGYELSASEGNRFRYAGMAGNSVDLLCQPEARRGGMGAGTVHHVAFRTETDEAQRHWQTRLAEQGLNVTPILDRQYFRSIYFREPGGVLFEIATDPPGFATDEALDQLGTHLKLPPWLERARPEIEQALPKLKMPVYVR